MNIVKTRTEVTASKDKFPEKTKVISDEILNYDT
jgi:hypothetical protein